MTVQCAKVHYKINLLHDAIRIRGRPNIIQLQRIGMMQPVVNLFSSGLVSD